MHPWYSQCTFLLLLKKSTYGDTNFVKASLLIDSLFNLRRSKYYFQIKSLLQNGGAKQEHYMSEMITHAIADDPSEDDYNEAKELFELTTVTVSNLVFHL